MNKPAFILLGGLRVIVRNWIYLTELERRGIKILVITSEGWRAETLKCMNSAEVPGSLIHDAAFVSGRVEVEGGFTAAVVQHVREWAGRFDIVGVFAVGEMLVQQTGIVADMLGLPSPGLRASMVCRSKYLQRFYLSEWGPEVSIVPPEERMMLHTHPFRFPAVLKPSGRRSSSGVHLVRDRNELSSQLERYDAGEVLLVEDLVHGDEYSVESLVRNGKIIFASATKKETTEVDSPWFVELSHTVPVPDGHGELLLATNQTIMERLEFADGIAHTELRLTPDGRVVLMEIAARTPGDGILPLYHLATGKPMEPEILKIALGEPASYPAPTRFARQVYPEHPMGILQDVRLRWPDVEPVWIARGELWPAIQPGEPQDDATLRAFLVSKERGSVLGELRESDDRSVTFFVDARSPRDLDEIERKVRESTEILLKEAEPPVFGST